MTRLTTQRRATPTWADSLHRLVLHGTPDSAVRADLLRNWNSHVADLYDDPTRGSLTTPFEVIRSGVLHCLWRLTHGPATTVSTGLLAGLVGLVTLAFIISDPEAMIASRNTLTLVGLLLLCYLLVRHPKSPPVKLTLITFGLLIPSGLWTAWEYVNDPEIGSERIGAVGALVCVGGAIEFSRSALANSHIIRARAWKLLALGIAAFAVANLIGATQYPDTGIRFTAGVASWIEALLAASLIRNSRSELQRAARA